MKIIQICPRHLPDVATLPWEIQKSHFQQYYSYILLISRDVTHQKLLKSVNFDSYSKNK